MKITAFIGAFGQAAMGLGNMFYGKPRLYWPARHACMAGCFEQLVLLTDMPVLANLAKNWHFQGFSVIEFPEGTKEETAMRQQTQSLEAYCRIHPQAVLALPEYLEEAVKHWEANPSESVVSACAIDGPVWCQGKLLASEGGWTPSGAFGIFSKGAQTQRPCLLPPYVRPLLAPFDEALALSVLRTSLLPDMAKQIKVFLTDVDGVMTDAGMYYVEGGGEFKRFHVHDGMALQQLQASGVKTGIITSENTDIVARRAAKLRFDYVHQGKRFGGKLQAAQAICEAEGISLLQVAYIGDDINCLDLLQQVGIAACPADATRHVQAIPGILKMRKGAGQGVVRELIEYLFPQVI